MGGKRKAVQTQRSIRGWSEAAFRAFLKLEIGEICGKFVFQKKTTELSGKIVAFLIGIAPINLEIDSVASEVKTLKSSPNYPDVIPKHKIVKEERRNISGRDVSFLVKGISP